MEISLGLLDSKESKLCNAVISKKRCHDFAFSSVDIILQNLQMCGHREMNGLLGHAVIMLATLGRVCIEVHERETGGKAGSNEL